MLDTQKKLEESLIDYLKEFYKVLKGFVESGNCFVDTGEHCYQIKKVELGADKNTKGKKVAKGFVFIVDKGEFDGCDT